MHKHTYGVTHYHCHTHNPVATPQQVLLKGDERLADVISQYACDSRADLLVTGSQNLCVDGKQSMLL